MGSGLSLRVELNDHLAEMFEDIKIYYGFETNSDAIRFLITEKHRQIKRERRDEEEKVPMADE